MASREWEIDEELRPLVGKMVDHTITPGEERRFDELVRERVRRMTPLRLVRR